MKKIMLIGCLLIGGVGLIGCLQNNGIVGNKVSFDKHIIDEGKEVFEYEISDKTLDRKAICEVLLPSYNVEKLPDVQENECTFVEDGNSEIVMGKGIVEFKSDDDSSKKGELIFYYMFSDVMEAGYDSKEQVEEISKLNDVVVVENKLEKLFLNSEDEKLLLNRAIRVNKLEMQDLSKKIADAEGESDVIENWNENEYIALEYEIEKNDIAIMGYEEPEQGYEIDVIGAKPVYLQLIISEGQIIYLEAQGMIDIKEGKTEKIISEEQAIEKANEEFKDVLSDDKRNLKCVKLEYVPIPDWTVVNSKPVKLTPYWCVIYEMENEELYEYAIRINAVNGGMLSYGE